MNYEHFVEFQFTKRLIIKLLHWNFIWKYGIDKTPSFITIRLAIYVVNILKPVFRKKLEHFMNYSLIFLVL